MELARSLLEKLIYGFGSHHRWTQDSPVLPDVWAFFAAPTDPAHGAQVPSIGSRSAQEAQDDADLGPPLEVLLTPHFDVSPGIVARELRARYDSSPLRRKKRGLRRKIGYTQSYVAARLYFEEIVQLVLPLTSWWRDFVWPDAFRDENSDAIEDRTLVDLLGSFDQEALAAVLADWSRTQQPEAQLSAALDPGGFWEPPKLHFEGGGSMELAESLLWMLRIVGTIAWARKLDSAEADDLRLELDRSCRIESLPTRDGGSVDYLPIVREACVLLDSRLPVLAGPVASVWQVNRNRPAKPAGATFGASSRRAIKADAAIHLFDIRCDRLTWAVIDSGIDASHPAFCGPCEPADWHRHTRIEKTYDFTRLRPLLDQELLRDILNADDVLQPDLGDDDLERQLRPFLQLIHRQDEIERKVAEANNKTYRRRRGALRRDLAELEKRLRAGREIDWALLEPLLAVPHHDERDPNYRYPVPLSAHGTHVAGILAGRMEEDGHEMFCGVCPDLRLYDLRVLDPHGPNDELTVLAALQFVQHLNLQKDLLVIQGTNLSLSIPHDVSSYACGRTPVCEECERLQASGVVVVAAAGNAGWDKGLAEAGPGAGYRTLSITDPGNAEAVITVGATHRERPHTYGVSFFSGRGPTGDGRSKPDLVAPGEKITSTIPGGRLTREDGTSQAAPHVSGAAALLMARHQELVGKPRRIKEILCSTATDLGRERHFQGAGMLDVLRALQSI